MVCWYLSRVITGDQTICWMNEWMNGKLFEKMFGVKKTQWEFEIIA